MTTLASLFVKLGLDSDDFDHGLRSAGDSADGFASRVGRAGANVASSLAGFASNGVLALGGATVAAVGFGLKTAASMETAQIGFETMLGSADKAKRFLGDLQAFAAKTPFEFPELQTAASSLISVGFSTKSVIPIMTTLGNVTSGMGTGSEGIQRATVALQQMSAAGRITGEDLNQLRDAGVPVFDLLSAATGKSKEEVAALAQAGKLGKNEMEQLFKALETGKGLERFNGLMEKQSQSLSGLVSTMKDTVAMGLSDAVKPLIPILSRALPTASALAGAAIAKLGELLQRAVQVGHMLWSQFGSGQLTIQTVTSAIGYLLGGSGHMATVLTDVANVGKDLWIVFRDGILPVFRDLTARMPSFLTPLGLARDALHFMADHAKALQPIIAMVLAGFLAFRTVTTVIQAVTAAQTALNIVMSLNPIGLVVVAIAALAAGLVYAWKNSETFRNVVLGTWAAITAAVGAAWDWIQGAGTAVAAAFSAAVDWITALPGRIVDAAVSARDAIGSFLGNLPGYLGTIVGTVIATFITTEIAVVRFWFELPGKIVDALVAAAPVVWNWFTQLPGVIWGFLSGSAEWLAGVGGNLMVGIFNGIVRWVPRLFDWFVQLPGVLWELLGGGAEALVGVGKNLVIGLWNGLVSMRSWLWDRVKDFFKGMLGPIGDALGLGSPSRITAQYGSWLVEGLANGMLSGEGLLNGVSDRIANAALPSIGSAAAGASGGGAGIAGAMAGVVGNSGEIVLEVDGYRLGKVLVPGVRAGLADVQRRNVSTGIV